MRILYLFCSIVLFFSLSVSAESGKDIFDRYCTVCHSPAMASMFGAPAAHDLSVWSERKENAFNRSGDTNSDRESVSMNELVKSAINGTDKGMPPKGTCADCTDEDIKSVIKFMSSAG